MTKQVTWEQIAKERDVEVGYLVRRLLKAEGKDPNDAEAMVALISEMEEHAGKRV